MFLLARNKTFNVRKTWKSGSLVSVGGTGSYGLGIGMPPMKTVFGALCLLELASFGENSFCMRWEGKACIDFFFQDLCQRCGVAKTLEPVLSDHKVISVDLELDINHVEEFVLQKTPSFERPAWRSEEQWQIIFSEAVCHWEMRGWDEACAVTEQYWGASLDSYCDQVVVDYTWALSCLRVLTCFRFAFHLALLCVPMEFGGSCEAHRVTHLANRLQLSIFPEEFFDPILGIRDVFLCCLGSFVTSLAEPMN